MNKCSVIDKKLNDIGKEYVGKINVYINLYKFDKIVGFLFGLWGLACGQEFKKNKK